MRSVSVLQRTSLVQRAPRILFSNLDDEWLAIDSESGYCYSLNATAGQVWELIAEPISVGSLCAELGRRFDVDEATCQSDVLELLQEMVTLGVVAAVTNPPPP